MAETNRSTWKINLLKANNRTLETIQLIGVFKYIPGLCTWNNCLQNT